MLKDEIKIKNQMFKDFIWWWKKIKSKCDNPIEQNEKKIKTWFLANKILKNQIKKIYIIQKNLTQVHMGPHTKSTCDIRVISSKTNWIKLWNLIIK